MGISELEEYVDYLLSIAINKCQNLEEAQDLVQDTFISAIKYISTGKVINNYQAFLKQILMRRFYDSLRKKYKLSTVYLGEVDDLIDSYDLHESLFSLDEAEVLREQIAYLSKLYREVIVRHYMNGENIAQIAEALNVPEGTVKSRLSNGRKHIKKGFDTMEGYVKESYEPINLYITNSGRTGINNEPWSLVGEDSIVQNLLYIAYQEPLTEVGLAKAIGIPLAYVEPIIERLINGELMKRVGNKVYTDFMISTIEDCEKHIPAQKSFVVKYFDRLWSPAADGLKKLRETSYYRNLGENQQQALELYFVFKVYDAGIYKAFSTIYDTEQVFPDRPNGGNWIAFANVRSQNYDYRDHVEYHKHNYAGERRIYLEEYLHAKTLGLHVFDPHGFPVAIYHWGEDGIWDDELIKLLYIIWEKIDPREIGFNVNALKSIPWLCRCRILREEGNQVEVDIPVLTIDEMQDLQLILSDVIDRVAKDISKPLKTFLKDKNQSLPKHLTSVPLQKQYLNSTDALLFATVREAMCRGALHDEGYDNEVQCPYPMVFVINK